MPEAEGCHEGDGTMRLTGAEGYIPSSTALDHVPGNCGWEVVVQPGQLVEVGICSRLKKIKVVDSVNGQWIILHSTLVPSDQIMLTEGCGFLSDHWRN